MSYEGNSSLSLSAADAYSTLFNNYDRRLRVIEDLTVEEYYLEQVRLPTLWGTFIILSGGSIPLQNISRMSPQPP